MVVEVVVEEKGEDDKGKNGKPEIGRRRPCKYQGTLVGRCICSCMGTAVKGQDVEKKVEFKRRVKKTNDSSPNECAKASTRGRVERGERKSSMNETCSREQRA
mgnify:CR=1 FL=1